MAQRTSIQPFLILSAFTKGSTDYRIPVCNTLTSCALNANDLRHKSALKFLVELGFDCLEGEGVFEGSTERCIAVRLPLDGAEQAREVGQLLVLASKYQQEAVLLVDNEARATLIDVRDGKRTALGKWVACTPEQSIGRDHSRFGNRLFICQPTPLYPTEV